MTNTILSLPGILLPRYELVIAIPNSVIPYLSNNVWPVILFHLSSTGTGNAADPEKKLRLFSIVRSNQIVLKQEKQRQQSTIQPEPLRAAQPLGNAVVMCNNTPRFAEG